ncbi:hypothetical protein, partial [Pedobacter ginsenosidimutans]|uniref:hypothetical protein n=1 Tax=Pedobacter ginsenosidimutans TaxID=687842 RepID=UPI000AD8197F
MLKAEGQNWISNLRKKWVSFYLISTVAIALSIALVLSAIGVYLLHFSPWLFAVIFPVILGIFLFIKPIWKTTDQDVSRFVNNQYPELEESADLLLQNQAELSMLQQLQISKIENIIPNLSQPKEPVKKLYSGLIILLVGLLISIGISQISLHKNEPLNFHEKASQIPAIKENIPAEISDFSATIIPPAYTQKAERKQKQFTIAAETGAKINWKIETNIG